MSDVVLRGITVDELDRIVEIDRTESIDALYVQSGTEIVLTPVAPFVGGWPDLAGTIVFCKGHMRANAEAIGAFEGARLVGIAMVTPNVAPKTAQLAFLHVTKALRRQGIASRLLEAAIRKARELGQETIYVTATPTPSAVGFYRQAGFAPTSQTIPHLFALEPHDIHMAAAL